MLDVHVASENIFYSTFEKSIVTIAPSISGDYRTFVLAWPVQTGVTGYDVYGSPTPLTPHKLNTVPVTGNTYVVAMPPSPMLVPREVTFYFWVKTLPADAYIQSWPASIWVSNNPFDVAASPFTTMYSQSMMVDQDAMSFYFQEIRRRAAALLENTHEDFTLYLRRYSGVPCEHEKYLDDGTPAKTTLIDSNIDSNSVDPDMTADPDFRGMSQCSLCFNTGITGGYYKAITLKARYGNLPYRNVNFLGQARVMVEEHNFNSWTLWSPRLKTHDFVVRNSTGQRFEIAEVAEAVFRGLPTRQEFKLLPINEGDIRYKVTDVAIQTAEQIAIDNDWLADHPGYTLWS